MYVITACHFTSLLPVTRTTIVATENGHGLYLLLRDFPVVTAADVGQRAEEIGS